MPDKQQITILFFGDIIGKIGRQALIAALPKLKAEYQPDLTIANVENLAHGFGINQKSWQDILTIGIDFGTSGNHIFAKPEGLEMLESSQIPIIRPANYPDGTPGRGWQIVDTPKGQILVINLLGRVFIDNEDKIANPFQVAKQIIDENKNNPKIKAVIIDIHAEATSEKVALGLFLDGQVSAIVGTHTHIPTADTRVLNNGTAYVTDLGMIGARDSVIGGSAGPIVQAFFETGDKGTYEVPKNGTCVVNGVLIEINPQTKLATKITRVDSEIEV
ncbi:MAG: TIGR00282 family metallophosphoesterase [Patescibacteria group bacterium]